MNEFINNILKQIDDCLNTGNFIDVEKSKVELKDLSSGKEWTSLKESVCAFLNTNGGYVICGVRERNKQYHFTGFDRNNESNLIDIQTKVFQNDNGVSIDLTDFIQFDYNSFRNSEVAIISITPLSDDLKFIKYNGEYYERKLTQDHKIPLARVAQQKEYKHEIEHAKELTIIDNAKLNDLSLDKINNYINLLNKSVRKETLKADIDKAKQFLEHRHFIKTNAITTLGMLVCGDNPFRFLENRAEVDCYYATSSTLLKDKKQFQDDVLTLMEEAFRFVWGHILTGKTVEQGGKAKPEYPEDLVQEMINNSLAHRDYTINDFVTIIVQPGTYLQIKNPGSFKERIKITNVNHGIAVRRLIPGIPESKNPKLASVLKVFDKIEGQGRGMASLVNAALDNNIDLPFYELKDEALISLTIPSGKLLDTESESWIASFERYLINKLKDKIKEEHKVILTYFRKSELLNKNRFYTILLSESNNHFTVIEQLKNAGLIYEHEASTESVPVFILDRELMKDNFTDELITLIGTSFIHYDSVSKNILNTLYRYTRYNELPVKPAVITPEIYYLEYGKIIDPKKYESLGRKARKICNDLSDRNILTKHDKGAYSLNFGYKQGSQHTLFGA